MKRIEKGRNQTLAGKRKSGSKAAGSKPNARRQRQIALRKKTARDNLLKRMKTEEKREDSASSENKEA